MVYPYLFVPSELAVYGKPMSTGTSGELYKEGLIDIHKHPGDKAKSRVVNDYSVLSQSI